MARGRHPANGVQLNQDVPPPSTLAAQIVQNRSRPAETQNGDGPNFAGLLHEILHNDAAAPENDVATNVQLISVISEIGLGPLTENNPFSYQPDHLIPQAIDSIAVIQATIKRQPVVLFTAIKTDGPQLILPILVRLFTLYRRPRCEELPIIQLLNSILATVESVIDLWQQADNIQRVLEDCVNDIVSSLESLCISTTTFTVKLPPARSVTKLWPQTETAISLPSDRQATLTDSVQVFVLALDICNLKPFPKAWRNEISIKMQRLLPSMQSKLRQANSLDDVSVKLLAAPNSLPVLKYLLENIPKITPPSHVQIRMVQSLEKSVQVDLHTVRDHLLEALQTAVKGDSFQNLTLELRSAVSTALDQLDGLKGSQQKDVVDEIVNLPISTTHLCHPRHKRRRLITEEPGNVSLRPTRTVLRLLTATQSENLTELAASASTVYLTLTEKDQRATWQALADMAPSNPLATAEVVTKLLSLPNGRMNNVQRVLAMSAVKACCENMVDPPHMDLADSPFGQTCLKNLCSSVRDLRVAAGQCLPTFLRSTLPSTVFIHNRKIALEYLRKLSDTDSEAEQETLISVWGHIAVCCGEKELNLTLLQLIDYLGHRNPLICGLAFVEVERIAATKKVAAEELLKPFWRSVAVSAVQDLHSRPQKVQHLCDLLGKDIDQFLVATERYTVPHLVLTKREDLLRRIAAARGKGTSVQDICLQPRTNLAAVVALLLLHHGARPEEATLSCLTEVAPGLKDLDLASFIKIDPMLIASCLLKNIGNLPDSQKSRGYQSFHVFANLSERGFGHARAHPKSSRATAEFFELYILGIMTYFAHILEEPHSIQPLSEKELCVKAVAEMILLAKGGVSDALPQIRASLQSAMDQTGLCEAAFSAWLNLLLVLNSDTLAAIVDQTFALVLQHWQSLSPELQQSTHERIAHLIKNHNQMMQDKIMTVPDMSRIPLLSKFASEIERLRLQQDKESHFRAFTRRLRDESKTVVTCALDELIPFLETNQGLLHEFAISEQPNAILTDLVRALLDSAVKYSLDDAAIANLFGRALGIVGCLDPNRVEAVRSKRRVLVLSNFETAHEVIEWVLVLLEDVLVKVFKSVSNARAQGFVAYVIQELLTFCGLHNADVLRPRATQTPSASQRFFDLPEHVRIILTPFVTSRYTVTSNNATPPNRKYPSFDVAAGYSSWLGQLVYDLLWKAKGDNPKMVFPLVARLIRGHDLSIANFVMPYAMLNVVIGGTVAEVKGIADELLAVLKHRPTSSAEYDTVKLCSDSIFGSLDYMSAFLQERKKGLGDVRATAFRTGQSPNEFDEAKAVAEIDTIEAFLSTIPADIIAARAIMCGAYSRALFHWEQYIRQQRSLIPSSKPFTQNSDDQALYDKLQTIYAQIEEPDGFEGITAHLTFLTDEQKATQHAKAGRWTAAQAYYEIQLVESPTNSEIEENLLGCLRQTGRYESLLRYADAFLRDRRGHVADRDNKSRSTLLPVILEAQWVTGDFEGMQAALESEISTISDDFNVGVGRMLTSLWKTDEDSFTKTLSGLREHITQAMTLANTDSVQGSHEALKRLHVLYEVEALATREMPPHSLDKRLAVVGSYLDDQQYILGVRRAVILARKLKYNGAELGASWLTTAKLARHSNNTDSAYNAVLKAYDCGLNGAKLEEARLLWRDGHQRQATQALESAISADIFNSLETDTTETTEESQVSHEQNTLSARAHLLLAKWLDASGQRQAKDMTQKYQSAAKLFQKWEKGHYYLGKHYQKLFDSEKALPKNKQSSAFLSGDLTRLVIENQLRSIPFGNKYWHQTIPKILTLWLDLGNETLTKPRNEEQSTFDQRVRILQSVHRQLSKYADRVPAYVFYSALPQMISRITHPNPEVWKMLSSMLSRIVSAHPNQALWAILAVTKSTDRTRVERGREVLNRLKDPNLKTKSSFSSSDLRVLITGAQKLSDGLLNVCEAQIRERVHHVSLSKDLGFNHKLAPSHLVVPIEQTLSSNSPNNANADTIRHYKPFAQDKITIASFSDEVLVLSSLQRPRKLTVRGSDGRQYGLLCKPKDDLRKDQRLMEFNGIINRALKRDAESSKRRLYIKTYAVTPLSEESGTIEWVEGIKPLRDILLSIYNRKGIRPQYQDLRKTLQDACSNRKNLHLFRDNVLNTFPASLHEWFNEIYPEPDTWFAARLRYARTAAVMSMTGHVLGLGDRHGENILLEQGTGGVFHVDFNCLFDKGLTFEKPELVPFRLTHNMVDAMGPYGYEGPFRRSSEVTLRLLRQSTDTLMTVLETFLYDPTTDFVGKKKRTTPGVPETPQEILDSVDGKLKGLLRGETVPLSVEGYVDTLISQAVDDHNLASMYIGWCAFL